MRGRGGLREAGRRCAAGTPPRARLGCFFQSHAGRPPPQSGSTPLHSAAGTNRFDVVRYLIEQEADLTLRDDDEKTPYEVAKSEGHTQCTELLKPTKGGGGGGGGGGDGGGGGCCVVQ